MRVAKAALESRDGPTSAHSDDVVVLCKAIADRLGIRGRERQNLIAAAQLHDVGKLAVPLEVIEKPGPLDEREWAAMRQHTIAGEVILGSVHELEEVARVVRSCHERYDGQGYPDGLAGDEIPLTARIVFCADAFHAMREDRPYRKGCSATRALAELRRNAGTQFDPRVVSALEDAARELRQAGPDRLATLSAPLRSRRLLALLLTMTIGGGTLAAAGVRLPTPFAGSESDEPGAAASAGGAECGADCMIDFNPFVGARGSGAGGTAPLLGFGGAPFALGGTRFGQAPGDPGGAPLVGGPGQSGPQTGSTAPEGGPGGERPPAAGPGGRAGEGQSEGAPESPADQPAGGGSTGDQSQGNESHGNEPSGLLEEASGLLEEGSGLLEETSGLLEETLPGGLPDVPVQLPDQPVDVPELPVRLPGLGLGGN
jgi:HD domain